VAATPKMATRAAEHTRGMTPVHQVRRLTFDRRFERPIKVKAYYSLAEVSVAS
jgi:hypothetical protein